MEYPKKSVLTAIGIFTGITILIVIATFYILINPADSDLRLALSNNKKAAQLKIDSLKIKITEQGKNSDSKLEKYLSLGVAYSLTQSEPISDIPMYCRNLTVDIFTDAKGVISMDTTERKEELVPPVLNWRDWKKFGKNVPTQVVVLDTTDSGELKNGEKYITIEYQLRPVFESSSTNSTKTKVDAKKDLKEIPAAKPAGKIIF